MAMEQRFTSQLGWGDRLRIHCIRNAATNPIETTEMTAVLVKRARMSGNTLLNSDCDG